MEHCTKKNSVVQNKTVIELTNVSKSFPLASGTFQALKQVSLQINAGQLVAITGKSGSGKSTLLNMLSGIDKPTSGSIEIQGTRIDTLSETALAAWRGRTMGVVFQFFQLLPTLTILENICLPMDLSNCIPRAEQPMRALQLLEQVGIKEQANKFPSALSGGQQQRAAIARALANDPPILVADEPTGNLDSQTAASIFHLFAQLARTGKTVIVVTHENEFLSGFETILTVADGEMAHFSPSNA